MGTGNASGVTCAGRTNVVSVGVTRMLEGGETLRGLELGCGRSRMEYVGYVGEGVGDVDFGRGDGARGAAWAG